MRYLALFLLMTACAGQTPNQQYFELKGNYAAVLHSAAEYRLDCDTKPKTDNCKSVVTKMQLVDKLAHIAFEEADKAITSDDKTWRDVAVNNAKLALANFQSFLKEYKI